ncbi:MULTISPECIES: hypothetical protein [Bradyrhizobium]|uniref:hypothetical protein n=1 Tax=Bradyrhizobium TaxID=374 RepID=UPI000F51E462|nr:hypothetical protein [Bradyrhizobium sp. RP6]RQH15950.1 hypothetical protein EHH60_01810 [Bradyrhizobium sp. RP6]
MQKRGDALALAVALSGGDEVTLGPTDSAMCAEALRFYANARLKERSLGVMRLPAIAIAALVGVAALSGSTAVIGNPATKAALADTAAVTATSVRRLPPIPHISPDSLAAQHFASAYPHDS